MSDGAREEAGFQPPNLRTDDVLNWDEIEENWLQQIAAARAKEDQEMGQEYDEEEAILHAELDDAICEHNRLTETLLQARVLVDEKQADIEWLLDEFRKRRKAVEDRRAADDLRVRAWIDKSRRLVEASHVQSPLEGDDDEGMLRAGGRRSDAALAPSDPNPTKTFALRNHAQAPDGRSQGDSHHSSAASTPAQNSEAAKAHGSLNPTWRIYRNGAPMTGRTSRHAHGGPSRSVSVVNSDGVGVGTVKPISPENHWVQTLLERPIRRPVEIRLGRKFTQSQLDSIYEGHDQKKSKWLSFMIQATGELQDRACQTCAKGQGLFSLCIIVGGPDFPRCGNCEWNKQGCHGAGGRLASRQAGPDHQHAEPPSRPTPPPLQTTPNAARTSSEPLLAGDSLSQASGANRRPRAKDQPPTTPQQLEPFMIKELSPSAMLEEITQDNLVLKDDGMIYLQPDIMRGVPLRKITPDHAYWEPEWKAIEGAVQNKLEEWMNKLTALKALPETSLTDKDRTAIFQAGRQVNRGNATLKYLSNCDFHPFQIVGKQWITPSLAHYDTLFRMVATLDELAKFRLDVSPLQWLRQRLYEIYCEKKSDFKLDRVIAKLYHDPKLAYLRSKNGFGNIGRPSAAMRPRNSDGGAGSNNSSAKKMTGDKRKEPPLASESAMSTPTKRAFTDSDKRSGKDATRQSRHKSQPGESLQQEAAAVAASQQSHRSRKPPSTKHREQTSAAPSFAASNSTEPLTEEDDLEYSGYTSTDSLTNDTVVKKDWRVHQVKTMRLTTNPRTTQYWHWVDEKHAHKTSGPGGPQDFDPMFEHQVLKETEPTTGWGVFKEPIDFHLRLRELTNVTYAPDSQKVVIGTRQVDGIERRGNVLAQFKRERTKRRFLSFMRKKGVEILRAQRDVIEDAWNHMQSEVMPGNESD